jgi:hypothetical protein
VSHCFYLTCKDDGDVYTWGRGFIKSFWYLSDPEGNEARPSICQYFKEWIVKDIAFGEQHALVVCSLVYVYDE